MEPVDAVRDQAVEIGRGWSGPDAPAGWALTAALFDGLAAEPALLKLAARIPPTRLPPLLFVASVQYVAARHPEDAFSMLFPTPDTPRQPPLPADFRDRYRAFCLEHQEEIDVWAGQRRHRRCDQGLRGRLNRSYKARVTRSVD